MALLRRRRYTAAPILSLPAELGYPAEAGSGEHRAFASSLLAVEPCHSIQAAIVQFPAECE